MGRFERSVELAKASWAVLKGDKQLVWLPILSAITTLIVMATFLLPAAVFAHDASSGGYTAKPVDWILGGVAYFAMAYVVVFFNAALVWAADRRLHGEPVTIGEAVHFSATRTHVLLPWAIVSATVSIILRGMERRAGIVGAIVGSIAGIAWALVTFLVLPVLVVEGLGPIAAVKRSGSLFKKTWGEQVIANFGISLFAMFALIAGLVPAALLFVVGGPIAVAGVVLFVAWAIAVIMVASALTGILQMALYRFATDGEVQGFNTDTLRSAFRPRHNRGFN